MVGLEDPHRFLVPTVLPTAPFFLVGFILDLLGTVSRFAASQSQVGESLLQAYCRLLSICSTLGV